MRHVGHLVGRDNAIDDRRAIRRQGFGDRAAQFVWMLRLESMAAAGPRQRDKIRIGKFNRVAERRQTLAFGLKHDKSKTRVIIHNDFHRQLVMHRREKLAHQHVETAIAGKRDDLARPVKRLDAVGPAERGSDRAIVERGQDPL